MASYESYEYATKPFLGMQVLPFPVAQFDEYHEQFLELPDEVVDVASEPPSSKSDLGLLSAPLGLLAGSLRAHQV